MIILDIMTITTESITREYALINYQEVVTYHSKPFYIKWFTEQPEAKYIEIDKQ